MVGSIEGRELQEIDIRGYDVRDTGTDREVSVLCHRVRGRRWSSADRCRKKSSQRTWH